MEPAVKLTDRVVSRLRSDRDRGRRFHDEDLPGFFRAVYRSGRKVFGVRFGPETGRRQVKIGAFGPFSARTARKEAQKILGQIALGTDPREGNPCISEAVSPASGSQRRTGPPVDLAERGRCCGGLSEEVHRVPASGVPPSFALRSLLTLPPGHGPSRLKRSPETHQSEPPVKIVHLHLAPAGRQAPRHLTWIAASHLLESLISTAVIGIRLLKGGRHCR